jgi:hypothetical protein
MTTYLAADSLRSGYSGYEGSGMKEVIQAVRVGGTLLDCRTLGSSGQLQVLIRANDSGLPLTFVVKAGVISLDHLRDHLGLPVTLTLENNVAVCVD